MEQHFQDVAQTVMHNNNLHFFAANFSKHYTARKNFVGFFISKDFLW